jgi:UDP-N-acetylmuramoylalanine--D-glutamate ligase
VKRVILYGQCREPIAKVFRAAGVPFEDCGSDFEKAVAAAVRSAVPGDTVMLSPGCASMDMFKNYQERGEEFKKAVRKIF